MAPVRNFSILRLYLFTLLFIIEGTFAALKRPRSAAERNFMPAKPPSIPLAVRSPYLSIWLSGRQKGSAPGGTLPGGTPTFWNGEAVKGWNGLVRVDGQTYVWMGPANGQKLATQVAFQYTSTKSEFSLDAGPVTMLVTFLSPVTPEDENRKRQSLVFSYIDVKVHSLDNKEHKVELYADITAEWVSGEASSVAQWETGKTASGVTFHKVYRQTQQAFTEVRDQTEYGSWYWATEGGKGVSVQSGAGNAVRSQFSSTGNLTGASDGNFRPINKDLPTFAFAKDLGTIASAQQAGALFTIGLAQDYAVQFAGAAGYNPVPSLWKSYFSDDLEAVDFFYNDYREVTKLSDSFDEKVKQDSIAAGGDDYNTITSLAVRQAFGAGQLVGNSTNPYLFLKEISSDGNVQTVDVIFPFHPILLYTNPKLLKLMLDPLFENQEAGRYPNTYSMHDIGSSYPNATGHPDGKDEEMPVEECGNMIIMTSAYAQRTGDTDYLSKHYNLLKQWAGYLVNDTLLPAYQLSTDDFAGHLANQTNLALKGILGIGAMSQIAKALGNEKDRGYYDGIARDYITKWQEYGIASSANPPHTTLSYGNNTSSGLLYNIYADRELGLNLVPQKVYEMQDNFYPSLIPKAKYGVPLDTRHTYTKADWEMFVAAVSSNATQRMFISDLARWIDETPTNLPFTDLYEVGNGAFPGAQFKARPVVGGVFALLGLTSAPGLEGRSNGHAKV